jgi:ATP-dependent helicase HrpB
MIPLPIDSVVDQVVARLRQSRAVVVVAPPGAGKTTRVPPAILRAGLLDPSHPNLVMLQPRRVAARAAAHRIAEEQGWTVGGEIGYQVRFERHVGPNTRLRVLTEGILNKQLLDDPSLPGVGCVVLDEFHERSLHTDLAVALLREVQQSLRPDLLLAVMSATLHAEPVAGFLGGCPVVRAEGRMFPVEIQYVPSNGARLPERVADSTAEVLTNQRVGDVLVFLPGAEEIRRTMRLVESTDAPVLPLYGSLPFEEQVRALRPSERRKVILATNIAETSLTIEGVTTVIDGGYARVAGYDPQRGLDRLELKRISKASAEQRAGRAGRMAPGRCIRLWSAKEQHELDDFELPEVMRVDLCGAVLSMHAWGQSDPRKFGWFERPPEEMLNAAEELLAMVGALEGGRITALGTKLLALPVHPRIGRLMLAASEAGRIEEGAAMAALLEEKDIIAAPAPGERGPLANVQSSSDLIERMRLLEEAEKVRFAAHLRDRGIDVTAARQVARVRDQLMRIARSSGTLSPALVLRTGRSSQRDDDLLRWPLLAYPDRVVRRRANDPSTGVMVGGGGVRFSAESTVKRGEFVVAIEARHDQRSAAREALVRIAGQVQVDWLEEMFPQSVRRDRSLVFDESRQRVVGLGTTWYRDLLLREDRDAPVDPAQTGPVLAQALRPRARETFDSNERAASWLARARFITSAMPDHNVPAFDDAMLGDVIEEACDRKKSVDDVRRAPLVALLQAKLPYQLNRLIDEHAPETIEVPSGSHIRLDYASGQRPVLAVRLQEIFGWTDTPRVAGGRVPILLHILGPNFRPVQVTDDLRSFWATTYAQVRKDLRVRYPRHAWPDDPLHAKPQAKGGRRRTT